MAIPSWPLTVEYRPITKSWGGTPYRAPLATDMEGGNTRQRSRPGDDVGTYTWSQDLSAAETATFDNFVTTTLVGGALSFYMPVKLPGGYRTRLVQIISGPPKYSQLEGGRWNVSFTLEVSPAVLTPAMPVITAVEPRVTGTSTASALIEVNFGTIIRTTTASAGGAWSVAVPYLEDGAYPIQARQTVGGIASPWCVPIEIVMPNAMMRSLRAMLPATEPSGIVYDLINDAAMVKAPAAPSSQNLGRVTDVTPLVRATSATRINASGVLETVAANALRFDYDPVTLAPRGALIEVGSTNLIRNNMMSGGVAGTPGVMPTYMSTFTPISGLSRQLSFGTYQGIECMNIRVFGTAATADYYSITLDGNPAPAVTGDTYTISNWLALVGGSLTNVTAIFQVISEQNGAGTWLEQSVGEQVYTINSTLKRVHTTRTMSQPTVAGSNGYYALYLTPGPVDFTLRIGLPQFQKRDVPDSVIRTNGAIASRYTDDLQYLLPAAFQQGQGTLMVEASQPFTAPTAFPGAASLVGTGDNLLGFYRYSASGAIYAAGRIASTGVGIGIGGIPAANAVWRGAMTWADGSQAYSYNGGAVMTSALSTMPTLINLVIGKFDGLWDGHIRKLIYIPRRIPNSQLPGLGA